MKLSTSPHRDRTDGWNISNVSDNVLIYKSKQVIDPFLNVPIDVYQHSISMSLLQEALKNNSVYFEYDTGYNGQRTITGTLYVSKSENRYINRFDNIFNVGNEIFTNDELIHAVKNTYPEKFI